MMDLKLPFFGKRGTIKSIKEVNNVYEVTRYSIQEKQIVPKKKKNLDGLYKNYHEDTKDYLEASYSKYIDYKNYLKERKKVNKYKLDLNKIKAIILASGIVTGISSIGLLALLPSASLLVYLDMSILAFSLVTLSASTNLLANYLKDKKKEKFITEYNNYQKEVNEYNLNNSKVKTNKPTKYRGISQEKSKENTIHKKKTLKKEELKNVA